MKKLLTGLAVAASLGAPVLAQEPAARPPLHSAPAWQIGPYFGIDAPTRVRGQTVDPDRRKIFAGVHVTGTLLHWGRWSFAYAPDIVPLLVVTNNPTFGSVVGFALSPIGCENQLVLAPRWRVYGEAAVGATWFTRDVPVPDSRAFNYTAEYGAGVQWEYRSRTFLRAGYKHHHLSNAGTGLTNPGLNGHVVTVGVARRIGRQK